jgi:ABC-2 type transport system permease protein
LTSPAIAQPSPEKAVFPFARRAWALALRHFFLYVGSWPRLAELLYWPVVDILMYGFISFYITRKLGNITVEANAFFGGLLLYEVLVRTTMGMLVMFMEELWSRNLGHLFASPLRLRDYLGGIISISFVRTSLAVTPAFILTFFLFGYSILSLGWPLVLYIALLFLNAWWYGLLVMSMILRFGLAAEWLGWMSLWLIAPFIAPYYPVSILPWGFQIISWSLPATYVFESMKSLTMTGDLKPEYLLISLGLNIFYFILAAIVVIRSFHGARIRGGLLQMGE